MGCCKYDFSLLFIIIFNHKWAEDQQDATGSAGANHTPNPDTTEVSLTPKSESTTSAVKKPTSRPSPSSSTLSQTRSNRSPLKPCKPHVLPATNTSLSTLERTTSTCAAASIPGTCCVLTRCCHALELIDCRLV